MQLEQLSINTQAKSSWQCFDLGCKVALNNYLCLFTLWILVSMPFFVFGQFISMAWGFLFFWLFKPWYERALIYVLSRAVFNTKVGLIDALKAWPSQVKSMWFSSVTYRRLAPSRSFDMAVTQLEGLRGEKRNHRLNVLHKTKDDNSGWWTLLCVHWEGFLFVGLLVGISQLVPLEVDFWSYLYESEFEESQFLSLLLVNLLMYLSAAFVAPFYVAGGFIAYLNRRMILEAWDIELGFKKWAKSASLKTTNAVKGLVCCAAMMILVFGQNISNPVQAQISEENNQTTISVEAEKPNEENTGNTENAADDEQNQDQEPNLAAKTKIREELETMFNEEPFSLTETYEYYQWKGTQDNNEEYTSSDFTGFASIANFIASFFEIFLWAAFVLIFGFIIVQNWTRIAAWFPQRSQAVDEVVIPEFIGKAFTENLPNDVSLAVSQAVEKKYYRRALSILVRASLTELSQQKKVSVTKSMTENECLAEIRQSSEEHVFEFMSRLLRTWINMAWAHKLPDANQLLSLLSEYQLTISATEQTGATTQGTESQNKDHESVDK